MDGLKARLSFDAVAYDYDDEYLTIDTDTHTININNVSRLFGVQYDGNSKLIKFRIRNKLSDIQKMQDSIVYINWIDSRGVKGQSIAINKTINNDTCEFAWKVPFDALKNSGVLHFAMSAVVTKNSSSVIEQRWSTQIASVITPDGIYIKYYAPSSEEEDRIAQIYNELSNMINKLNDNLQSQVNSLKEDLVNLDLADGFIQKNFEENKGTFISDNGQYVKNDGTTTFAYSSPIPVSTGDIVKFTATGYLNYVAMISFTDDKGNILKVHKICQDSNEHTYTLNVYTDGYIAVSFDFTKKHMLFINDNKINKLSNKIDNLNNLSNLRYPEYTLTFNKYIQAGSVILESQGSCYSTPILLKANETIVLNACGYLDNVAMISTCDIDGNNINMVVRSSGNELKEYSYSTDVDTYVIISYLYTSENSAKIIKEVNEEELEYVNLSLFNKFGVIGDSYASGELWYDENYTQHKDDYPISWGQILARTLGTNCTNYSSGGLTTRSWLTAEKGLPLLNSSEPEDIYYLALGINDWYAIGESYLGTESDMESKADTFYGNYAKIIEAIRNHSPNAKLIMFTMADTGTLQQKFNNAIINIAKHYGLPYIVQANDEYFKSHIYLDMTNGHPRATGYAGMANAFERLIKKCILKYYDYFKDSFMY